MTTHKLSAEAEKKRQAEVEEKISFGSSADYLADMFNAGYLFAKEESQKEIDNLKRQIEIFRTSVDEYLLLVGKVTSESKT